MSNINYIYFQESKLESVIEIKDIVAMRYYEFQNDVIFNKPEVHNFWEFVYVDKGQIKIIADDNCFTLKWCFINRDRRMTCLETVLLRQMSLSAASSVTARL